MHKLDPRRRWTHDRWVDALLVVLMLIIVMIAAAGYLVGRFPGELCIISIDGDGRSVACPNFPF